MFQQFFLAEHQTILDNVADGLLYAGVRQAERRERACEALDLVDLGSSPRGHDRRSYREDNANVWLSPEPSSAIRPSSWPTSPPATSTRSRARRSSSLLAAAPRARRHHSSSSLTTRHIAERMPRRVEMLDGRIVSDTPTATSHGPASLDRAP